MSVIREIATGLDEGLKLYNELMESGDAASFKVFERHIFDTESSVKGTNLGSLACGDNVQYMKWLLDNGYAGKIKCIYIDPPFFTKAKYNATISFKDKDGKSKKVHHLAYDDTFERNLEFYIENMTLRLLLMKDLLADDGLLWVHLDWHSSHYVKVILDEIMGEKHFVNEIIWKYKSGGSSKKHFSRKHDSILVYSKSSSYKLHIPTEKSYNRGLKPYNFKGVKEFSDEFGWYTLVNMKDVWTIDMVGRTSVERTGYATQKPLELMRRIIEASTNEGDLCADFFCGSGAFLCEAKALGRGFLGCDIEELATAMTKKRLVSMEAGFDYYSTSNDIHRKNRTFFEIRNCDALENGKSLYSYALTKFEPDLDIGHVPMKERELVSNLEDDDIMSLIDYIMVDPYYNGEFSAEMIVESDYDSIRFISRGNIAFIVVDIFGREYFFSSMN